MSRGDALVTEAPVEPEREAAPTGSEARALARAGASGVAWQSLAQVVSRVLTMIATVALARALSVEEYGLVAAALVIIGFVETVADAGVAQALVYLPKRAGLVRAAFAITVTTGVLLAIGVVLAAPVLAIAFGNPGIEPLVRALGIVVMLTALAAVPDALLRRELEFRRLTIAAMVRAALNAVVTLGLLVAGFGPWSLVWGTVAGAVAYLLACWFLAPPGSARELRGTVSAGDLAETVRFGAPVAGNQLLSRTAFDVDYLVVGAVLGSTALGVYTLAFRLPEMLIIQVCFVIAGVMYPLYTRARATPRLLERAWIVSTQAQILFGLTAGVGLAVIAHDLVPLVFGQQWESAGEVLVFLALYAGVRSMANGANEVYKALGRPMISLWTSVARLAVLIPALFFSARWGLVGIACTHLVVEALFVVVKQTIATRMLRLRVRDLWTMLGPGLVSAAGVAVLAFALHQSGLTGWPLVIAIVGSGLVAVPVLVLAFFPSVVGHLGAILPGRLGVHASDVTRWASAVEYPARHSARR